MVRLRAMAAALPSEFVVANAEQVATWFRESPDLEHLGRGRSHGSVIAYSRDGSSSYGGGSRMEGVRGVREVFEEAVLAVAQTDRVAALDHAKAVETLRDPFGGESLMARLAGDWAENAPLEALSWLGEQEGDVQRSVGSSNVFSQAFSDLPAGDFQRTLELIAAGIERPGMQSFLGAIAKNRAQQGADEMLEFADSLPAELAKHAMEPMMQQLAQIDPLRAEQELGRLEEGPRKQVERTMVAWLSRTDPHAALELMQRLPEDHRTASMYQRVIPRWAKRDWTSRARLVRRPSGGC